MPISAAKRAGNDRYNAKCDTIQIRPQKATGERIRAAAAAAGESLQGYILQAVQERMDRETKDKFMDQQGGQQNAGG